MIPPLLTTPIERKITIDFTQSGSAPAILTALGATFSRSQTRNRWNPDNTITTLSSNVMPISWTPGVGWGYIPEFGLISRWTQSNTPGNAAWTKNGYTATATTMASPLSGLSAYWIPETATTAVHEVSRTQSATSGALYGVHAVVKMESRRYIAIVFKTTNSVFVGETVVFDTVNKTVFSNTSNLPAAIYDRGSFVEIYAITAAVATATGTMAIVGCDDAGVPSTSVTYAGDTAKGFWWFNVQQTSARSMPPVIVTTTGSITLTADSLSFPVPSVSRFDSGNFSVVADYMLRPYYANSVGVIFSTAYDASNLGQIYINYATSNAIVQNTGSGTSAFATLPCRLGVDTLASGFLRGTSYLSVDARSVKSGGSARQIQSTTAYIGSNRTFGGQFYNPILWLRIYKQALPLARLAQLGRYIP